MVLGPSEAAKEKPNRGGGSSTSGWVAAFRPNCLVRILLGFWTNYVRQTSESFFYCTFPSSFQHCKPSIVKFHKVSNKILKQPLRTTSLSDESDTAKLESSSNLKIKSLKSFELFSWTFIHFEQRHWTVMVKVLSLALVFAFCFSCQVLDSGALPSNLKMETYFRKGSFIESGRTGRST